MASPLWGAMSTQRRRLAVACLVGALASGCAVALLGTAGWLISRASQTPPVLTLGVAAVLVRAFALGRALLRYTERLVAHDAALRGLTRLRVRVYQGLVRLAPSGLRAFGRGDLLARLGADVDAALDLPVRVVLPWAQAALVTVATVAFLMFCLPGAGAIVAVLAVLALVAVPWLAARGAGRAQARMAPEQARLIGTVVFVLDSTAELSTLGSAQSARAAVAAVDADVTRLTARVSSSMGVGLGLATAVQGAAVALSLSVGVLAVTDGRLDPVWLAVVALLPLALFEALSALPASALAYQRLHGSAVRIAEIDRTAPPAASSGSAELPEAFGGVDLRTASVRWPGEEADRERAPALRDISLQIGVGERVAVVGPSGAGKSTLAATLMGFVPYAGSVRVSGVEVRDADAAGLRLQIGMLSQRAHVFDATVADNLRIGNPSATVAQMREVLQRTRLTDWLDRLADGLDTTVGAFGARMSGGERQRLALARLLLARRPMVILDEPTEHLDAPGASAMTEMLVDALADSTVLLITHRVLDAALADRILVLDHGRIVDAGSHAELVARDGWYRDQWRIESQRRDMAVLLAGLPVGVAVAGPAMSAPMSALAPPSAPIGRVEG